MPDKFRWIVEKAKFYVLWVVKITPIVSGLPDLKSSDHADAFKEASVTFVLATMPIWLGAFIAALLDNSYSAHGVLNFFGLILQKLFITAQSGVLIAYSATLVAPVLYMALSEVKQGSTVKFPSQISHVMVVLMVTVVAAAYYTATLIKDGDLNAGAVFYTSLILFLFSLLVYYVALCYKYFVNNYKHSDTVKLGSEEFGRKFRDFIGGEE